jgi:energy-coupling factor transporter ATP-binding protein EcfA2
VSRAAHKDIGNFGKRCPVNKKYRSARVFKARLLKPGLCVLVLLLLAAPARAETERPCDKFFDPEAASNATEYERRACMVEMAGHYSESWRKIPSGRLPMLILKPASGEEIYTALPEESKSATGDEMVLWFIGAALTTLLAALLTPGLFVLEHLFFTPDSWPELIAAALISWWVYVTVLRMTWVIPGRIFGFYDPRDFAVWLNRWVSWRPFWLWDNGKRAFGLVRVIGVFRQLRHGRGANNKWAGFFETMTYVFHPGDCILVGRLWWHRLSLFQPIAIPGGGRHVALVGASGSGKSNQLSTMIGMLNKDDSCFVVDVDGAMVDALGAALEAAGHKVVKLDADGIAKGFTAGGRWNPMDELTKADERHGRASVVSFAERLANALIVQDSQTQPVFADTARVFMKVLILYVWLVEDRKTLARVRELLTCGLPEKVEKDNEDPFERLLFEMSVLGLHFDDGCDGEICKVIAGGCGVMRMGRHDKGNNFKSTAIYQTAWLDDTAIRPMMETSDINGEDLKFTNACVFMVSTLSDIQTRMAPYFRAFIVMTMYSFERAEKLKEKLDKPCLFILDEMPSYGRIDTLATAAPGFRKYGIRLVTVTQSLQRLKKSYPNDWADFLGNAQCVVWMGLDDPETLEHLSKKLGKYLHKEKVEGTPWWQFWGEKVKARYQRVERELMTPQQCAEFLDPRTRQIIVTRFGASPMRLRQLAYFRELPVWKYAVNVYGESWPRLVTRGLIRWFEERAPVIAERVAGRVADYADRTFDSYGERWTPQTMALVLGFAALRFGIVGEPEKIDGWPELFLFEAFRVAAGVSGGCALLWGIYDILKAAHTTAAALVAGSFDGEHPYGARPIKFFSGMVALTAGLCAAERLMAGFAPGVESTPLRWALYAVIAILFLPLVIFFFFATPILPPLLYGVSVVALWPLLRLKQTAPAQWVTWEAIRLTLRAVSLLPEKNTARKMLTRWLVRFRPARGRESVRVTHAGAGR